MSLIKFYRSDRTTAGITDSIFKELEAAAGKSLAEPIDLSLPDDIYGMDAGLYPRVANVMERAQASKWIVWGNVSLPTCIHQIFRVLHMKPDPDANGQLVRVNDAEEAKESMAKQLQVLDGELNGRSYLLGEKYSLVDTHVLPTINYLMMAGVEMNKTPNLRAWMDKVSAREQLQG